MLLFSLYLGFLVGGLFLLNHLHNKKIELLKDSLDTRVDAIDIVLLSIANTINKVTNSLLNGSGYDSDVLSKIESSTNNFSRIDEITKEQLELLSHVDAPSSSPSHSKFKNDIVQKLKALEEEKLELMQGILDEGINPEVQVLGDDGSVKSAKMSDIVDKYRKAYDKAKDSKSTPKTKTESKSPENKNEDSKVISLFAKKGDNHEPRDPTLS